MALKDDIIFACGGDDVIIGGDGDDLIFGQKGDDILRGDEADDIAASYFDDSPVTAKSSGDDIIEGGDGIDDIAGGDGADALAADEFNNFDLDGDGLTSDTLSNIAGFNPFDDPDEINLTSSYDCLDLVQHADIGIRIIVTLVRQ